MMIELALFGAGCFVGGYVVYRGMTSAIAHELRKRPWTEAEKTLRAAMLAEAMQLSKQTDNPEAIRRSNELRKRLIEDDMKRETIDGS